MKRLLTALTILFVAGCASAPPAAPPTQVADLFADVLFAPPSEAIDTTSVFALSEDMVAYLDAVIAPAIQRKGRQRALFDALYAQGQLRLEYDASMTRNARQAFAARTGNCLSLVVMTAAFAKHLGLQVRYQSVLTDENWSRSGNLYLSSGHVNIALGRKSEDLRWSAHEPASFLIDFLPPPDLAGQRTRVIGEATILAMFMNNRAAEALVSGRIDDAYWWARAAILQDETFLTGINTLGVIYSRRSNLSQAERVFRNVLAVEPANTVALSNLVHVLEQQGRHAESKPWKEKLARIEPDPPYHFFNLGMQAMQSGDFRLAREMFRKEVDRSAYQHEFHLMLGLANFYLGEVELTRKHLEIARDNATVKADRDLYSAKLERLKALRAAPQRTQ